MVGNPELSDGDLGGRGAAGGPPAPDMPVEGCGAGSGGWKGEEMSGKEGRPDPGVSGLAGANGARYKSMPPARLPITRAPCLTIPPGFSPSALLESPVLLTNMKAEPSPTTGTLNLSSIIDKTVCSYTLSSAKDASNVSAYDGGNSGDFEFKPHVPASYNLGLSSLRSLGSVGIIQAVQEPPVQNQSRSQDRNCITCNNELAPLASAPNSTTKVSNLQSSLPAEAASGDLQLTKCSEQSSQMSQSDPSEPTPSSLLEKSSEDGYNWRKYGQKHVKGSEYPRSYYKCTHPNCEMKKQIERSHDGQITGIIYIGKHDHPKPHPNRRLAAGAILSCQEAEKTDNFSSLMCAEDESTSASGPTSHQADPNSTTELSPASISENDVKVGCGQSDNCDEVAGDADLESKRRKIEINNNDAASIGKMNHEPRVVVQTLSEVDILDDGYRWRKYGQKVVKGNPNPRSYYKCTSAGCPVRKHVERASHDPKAVITTYEGKHNHDVPAAKTANHEASGSMVRDGGNSLSIHASAALNGMMSMRRFTHPFIQMESNTISLDLGVGISPIQSEITNGKQQCLENFQIQHHQPQCVDSGNLAIQTTPLSNFHGSSHARIYPSGEDKGEGFTFKATPVSSDMYYSTAGNLVMGP
ncbi:WRKY transcription factor [Musa troglodytarum]|uniref:WRKY transcription factor n=1 Tax=Musa troglodytarum TaxID=320322 RepID=A0A9E7EEY2_9LILI|nr:WRKY transcription factor [Musa troglodytarum]